MGIRVEPRERITQKSVSIKSRQREFIDFMEVENKDFSVNKILQKELDKQILLINPKYLNKDDPNYIE